VSTNAKGESLGYGFVHYESEEAAANAISRVDGKLITGEKVEVSAFKSRKERGGNKFRFTNVYAKNLPLEWNKDQLDAEFTKYGEITSRMLAVDEEGKSKGFGFVNFKNPEDASAAVEALNGLELGEKKLYVVRAQKKEEREKELRERFEQLKIERQKKYAGVNLYVKNLGDDVEDERLHAEFAKFGNITSAHVMRDSNNKSKGFGFVCFSTPEEATKAVTEMNGRMLNMKPLYVALAQRKEVRRAQLEAQYAQRAKVGMPMPQPHVFGPGGMPQVPGGPAAGPMFYQGVPQRNFVYPQQMMARQWNMTGQPSAQGGQQGGAMQMRPPHPSVGYQLMAMNQQQRPARGGRGQNRPNTRPQQTKQQPGPAPAQQAAPAQSAAAGPLTAKALAEANDEQKKQMIGERLFPLIKAQQPTLAGKITGMLLEMDNTELLHLLESPQALGEKIQEALEVLNEHGGDTAE